MKFAGLLAAAGVALILVASADAKLIVGTRGPDLLLGTVRPDRLVARGGNDRIDVAGGGRDTVSCGPGVDVVAADATDRLTADCERVSRRLATDPYSSGGAEHASHAEPDSFSWGSTVVATYQVARFSSGGAMNIGFAVSSNSGRTWLSGLLPSLTVASRPPDAFLRASDPSVAYDDAHGVWLISSLAFSDVESAILVSSSRDGIHWSAPVAAARKPNDQNGIVLDKEWIVCDNGVASPFHGRCYLSYSDFEALRLATQTSTDGGQTWSAAVGSPDNAGRRGIQGSFAPAPQPLALPNGDVVVPIYDSEISVVRSTDGGASFSPGIHVAPASFFLSERLRAGPFPSAEIGADGTIMMAWADCGLRARCTGNDLLFTTSRNGLTWTPPTKVPLGAGNHVIDGLAADGSRPGRVAIAYYTDLGGKLDVGFVSSSDGGANWSPPVRLSPERMPYSRIAFSNGAMVGDYISTSFAGGRAVSVFTLAQSKLHGGLRQATYASSIAVP